VLVVGTGSYFVFFHAAGGQSELAKAREAVAVRDFPRAIAILDKRLQENPADLEARLLAAQSARRSNQLHKIGDYLRDYEKHGGRTDAVALEERLRLVQSGDVKAVADLLRECEKSEPSAENFLKYEAIVIGCLEILAVKHRAGEPLETGPEIEQAIRAVERLLQMPMSKWDNAEAFLWSGTIHSRAKLHSRAVSDLRKATELVPHHFDARKYLALTIAQESPSESISILEALVKERPDDRANQYMLAASYRVVGRTDEAGLVLDSLLRARPGEPQFLIERGKVAIDAGNAAEGEVYLREAAETLPDDPDVLVGLSKCLRLQGKTDEADRLNKRFNDVLEKQSKQVDQKKSKP